ncbi:hypothetical protein WQ54_15210 [Bacillus sp. SA1-12]|nr:hypothetical protein WQ54_15210 [Bacillus sp. SA1-12]
MLKNTITLVKIVSLILLLAGCTSLNTDESPSKNYEENQTLQEQENQTLQEQNKVKINQGDIPTLEKKLIPPKFIIKKFTATYDKSKKEIIYQINYKIDLEIYNILTKGKQEMYFSLEYPESVQKYYNNYYSELIEPQRPKNLKMGYQISFKQKPIRELNNEEIQNITNNLEKYNLHIADKDKDVISIYDDIIGFMDYEPGISKSEHIDETKK